MALDVVRGLVFLHSNKVVHADLKGKNILLTQNAGMPPYAVCYNHNCTAHQHVLVSGCSIRGVDLRKGCVQWIRPSILEYPKGVLLFIRGCYVPQGGGIVPQGGVIVPQ